MTKPIRLRLPREGIESMFWCAEQPSRVLYLSPVAPNVRSL
jgi:hypothetical protein